MLRVVDTAADIGIAMWLECVPGLQAMTPQLQRPGWECQRCGGFGQTLVTLFVSIQFLIAQRMTICVQGRKHASGVNAQA